MFERGDKVFILKNGSKIPAEINDIVQGNDVVSYVVIDEDGNISILLATDLELQSNSTYKQTTPPKQGEVEVLPLVQKDFEERGIMGVAKYEHPLETFNGRSPLQDGYEESIDKTLYLKQAILEIEELKKMLYSVINSIEPFSETSYTITQENVGTLKNVYTRMGGVL